MRRLGPAAALLLAWLPASASACGWWGDAEHDGAAPAVTVDARGVEGAARAARVLDEAGRADAERRLRSHTAERP